MEQKGEMTRGFPRWAAVAALGFLLLPVLFGSVVGLVSAVRWGWELCYLLLAAGVPVGLRRLDPAGRGGWWAVSMGLAMGAGSLCCENPLLGAGLLAVGLVTALGAGAPWWAKGLTVLGLCGVGLLVGLRLLVFLVFGGPQYTAVVPMEERGAYAQVEVRDPGAMGRIRYHATEYGQLLNLGALGRVGMITGRDSAASGNGKYGYIIDGYFMETGG